MAGFSVGANASTVDEGCSARETARVAAMIGRMDVANAILDNLPIVQAAMKAKAAREAAALPAKAEMPATTSPAQWSPGPAQTQEQREAALREQQKLAQEALQRSATMAKLNDTLKFTDATTQGSEKTPQEIMAEETTKKMAAAKAEEATRAQANNGSAVPSSATQQANNKPDGQATTRPLESQQPIRPETIAQSTDRKVSPDSQAMNTQQSQQNPMQVNTQQSQQNPMQTARPEGPKPSVNKAPSAAMTTEERVRAARAALNLQ
jgi:hypothetical protein